MEEKQSLEDIRSFLRLSDSIATAGQPTPEQFSSIKEAGFQIVVNLATSASSHHLPQEKKIAEEHRLQYIHIPVDWDHPRVEDAQQFFNVLNGNSDKKIFVHCALNMRVSAFMYLYRILHLGMAPDDAVKDLHRIWEPNETWLQFMSEVIKAESALTEGSEGEDS